MAADDRRRKILDHLSNSTNGIKYTSPTGKKNSSATSRMTSPSFEPELPITPPPTPKVENRKKNVLEHLNLSSENFNRLANDSERQRKQKIQSHLKKSLS